MLEKVHSLICAQPLILYAGGVLPDGKVLLHRLQHNAKAMDTHGAKVAKTLMDAQKKKKKMTVCLRPILQKVTLTHIIHAYMADGGGKKKEKKGKKAESTERDENVCAGLAHFEQQAPADEPVKAQPFEKPVNPTSGAPSSSVEAAVVEATAEVLADHEKIREVMGPNVDPGKVIERCREGAAHSAAMLNARKAQN
jgi:hypothetical protein